MTQHVTNAGLRNKKPVLWTPWGSQRVPDLDKALEKTPPKRTAKRRPAQPGTGPQAGKPSLG